MISGDAPVRLRLPVYSTRRNENMKHINPAAVGESVVQILERQDLDTDEVVLLVKRARETSAYNLYGCR